MRDLIKKSLVFFYCLVFLFLGISAECNAADRSKGGGAYLSIHGDPPPSLLGLNLNLNLFQFRISAGVGTYASAVSNISRGFSNYSFMPIGFAFYWMGDLLGQILSQGKVTTHKDYSKYRMPYESNQSIFSYGMALKWLPLSSPLSPLVGIGYSRFTTQRNPFGLPDQQSFVYFPVGIDYVLNRLNLGVGYNFCPAIQQKASGLFLNFGSQF